MVTEMFTVEDRNRVRAALIEFAQQDERVVAGAEVGSLTGAAGAASVGGDRWSDLDLTFGLAPGVEPRALLDDWTAHLAEKWDAVALFDLGSVATLYRVFLFPGNLQVDLSATPGGVARMGPKFRLLFGDAVRDDSPPRVEAGEIFGLCVHHALRSRVCIERGRLWTAEFSISELRHETLALAAASRGLPTRYGRAYHELPDALVGRAAETLVRSVDVGELNRALTAAIGLLLDVARDLDHAPHLDAALREMANGGG
jgi:hypothetical protein